jgi:hypothetical protein
VRLDDPTSAPERAGSCALTTEPLNLNVRTLAAGRQDLGMGTRGPWRPERADTCERTSGDIRLIERTHTPNRRHARNLESRASSP